MHIPELTDVQWQKVKDEFGTAIRECREYKDATQDDWAAWLGVKQTTVSCWEKGKSMPRSRTLYRLCKYMGISVDYLFGVSQDRHHPQARARARARN